MSSVFKILGLSSPENKVRMRQFTRFEVIGAALLLSICAFSRPASADTESVVGCSACGGYVFSATVTPTGANDYNLSYTITDVSGPSATAQGWSLTLFQSGNDITYTSGSLNVFSSNALAPNNAGAYTVMAGKSNNGNGDCNSSLSDAICVTTSGSGSPSVIGLGETLTFNFSFTCPNCTELSSWHFMSHGTCVGGTGNCYAVTNDGTSATVPEPSVLALLTWQMALIAGIMLVFGPVRSRFIQRGANLFRLQTRLTS
jgi:hypothetical protein